MSTLEQRLRRLEDRAELDDLIVRYFLACDGDDMQGVGDSFTQEATFASSGALNAQGREAIVDFIRTSREHMGLTVHTPHYGLYTFHDDDRAEGLVGAHLELVLAGQPLLGAVRYQDEYRRTSEGWRIVHRDMRTIHIAPWNEVGGSMLSPTPVRWPGIAPLPSDYPRK
ncbi:nuclear transport factor 2 family protein [Novosphingobium resinovorum]|uniref:nuclear transport factor 2 family protein n=1 Tax=Novosphingobium resinovorum TaxID=158500 RepID=UPI002ED2B7B0|nr:nuclear transport factor 2 family protein [Novosphingobium resinovorum]